MAFSTRYEPPRALYSDVSRPDTIYQAFQKSSDQRDIDAVRCLSNLRVEGIVIPTRHQ